MRTAWETFPIEFKGGLKTNVSPLQQGINFPGSATKLTNFEPSIAGGYKKITGYDKWVEFAVPGSGLISGVMAVTKDNAVVVRGGIYYSSVGKADWVSKLNIGDALGTKIRYTRFNFNGTPKLCMVDGIHRPVFYDSVANTVTQDAAAPTDVLGATRVVEFKNRLFFANGNKLAFTAPYAETDYNPANGAGLINVGDVITGLAVFREQLIIFCVDQIKRLVGSSPSDYQLLDITKKTGAIDGDTIQEVGGDILYLGPDGMRFLSATERNEDFGLQRASEDIQSDVLRTFAGAVNYCSLVIRGKAQYRIFRYDTSTPKASSKGFIGVRFQDQSDVGIEWSETLGIKAYRADSQQFGNSEIILFTNEDNYVYQFEIGNSFDGMPITCIFKTPFIPVNDPQVRKTFYKHTLYLNTNGALDINFRLYLDYEASGTVQPSAIIVKSDTSQSSTYGTSVYGTSTYGGASKSVYNSQVIGSGFTVALSYSETSTQPAFSLDTAVLEYRQNDRK